MILFTFRSFRETELWRRFTLTVLFGHDPLLSDIMLAGAWIGIHFLSETSIIDGINM